MHSKYFDYALCFSYTLKSRKNIVGTILVPLVGQPTVNERPCPSFSQIHSLYVLSDPAKLELCFKLNLKIRRMIFKGYSRFQVRFKLRSVGSQNYAFNYCVTLRG